MDNGANMIPAFLTSLADRVDRLVVQGKAVHVTKETAAELRLLAGLPWDEVCIEGPCRNLPGEQCAQRSCRPLVTPGDFALALLLASRCVVVVPSDDVLKRFGSGHPAIWVDEVGINRAAVCAELAVLASKWQGKDGGWDMDAAPHDGTREGARAAWKFITETLEFCANASYLTYDSKACVETILAERRQYQAMAPVYRRELEAMR
jgi:hypothetical protein